MTVNEYRKKLIDKYQFDTTHYNETLETLVNNYIERKKRDRINKIKKIYG